jgi:hypothetical protein
MKDCLPSASDAVYVMQWNSLLNYQIQNESLSPVQLEVHEDKIIARLQSAKATVR